MTATVPELLRIRRSPTSRQYRTPSTLTATTAEQLTVSQDGDTLTVTSQAYARGVEIYSPDSDFVLSDNFFDMEKGSRSVQVTEGTPKTLRVRSTWDIR